MDNIPRPSIVDRTMSTPLFINTASMMSKPNLAAMPFRNELGILTPPSSPRHTRSSSNISNKSEDSIPGDQIYRRSRAPSKLSAPPSQYMSMSGLLLCPYEVENIKDHHDQNQILGHGAWSTVFRGKCHQKSHADMTTPPLSPVTRPPLLVAVKQPARKDAKIIIENEAKILTRLMMQPENERYVVSFYGIIESTSSLVLAALSLSLEDHIKQSAVIAKAQRTTWNMSEPVLGDTKIWLSLAHKTICALHWLHEQAMVIHGDIKPANILLSRREMGKTTEILEEEKQFEYEPIFIDFSSSQTLETAEPTPNTLSAITREYTAPELLSVKVLTNPDSTATKASDVFSLAVTLLVAATGNTMVYSGSVYQRQAMATQGWMVIQSVRNGPMEEGARVPRRGLVENLLEKAVLRDTAIRTNTIDWKAYAEELMATHPIEN